MTLFLNNDDVKNLLTMEVTLEALERSYAQMIQGEAVCRPRIDLQIPTQDPQKIYQWGTMEGGSSSGYFAIRMKSDVLEGKVVYLKDILEGKRGRGASQEITYSERGNLQGAQFHAVAGRVYELARERGIGREIPTEWFLQDIRD